MIRKGMVIFMIKERITELRKRMKDSKINVYIIGTADYHQSEYTGKYFNAREFMSGFTGSAGTLVVSEAEAVLFTDGRYFIQAEKQLEGTEIKLMKSGTDGVPSVEEYIVGHILAGQYVGFDGRVVAAKWGISLEQDLIYKGAEIKYEVDFVSEIWVDRPEMSKEPVYLLTEKYAGKSEVDKLKMLRNYMLEKHADIHIISTLDDICWLFNIRGNDVKCNPVVLAFAAVTDSAAYIFTDQSKFSDDIQKYLLEKGIILKAYGEIYDFVSNIQHSTTVLADTGRMNYTLYKKIPGSVRVIDEQNPTVLMKAVKNETEQENLRQIHIQDGVAVTKFMYWLKENVKTQKMTEVDAQQYIDSCRSKIDGFLDLSFDTISAYNENAAMMHYRASEKNCVQLKPEGMLLVDSGGQYYKGTTDITRTFALGDVTEDMKKHFTLTLKGMLTLAHAKFLYGCNGFNLDILARQPLWNEGIDYRCGTGHGIGYLLNVHEAPNGFRWKHMPGRNDLSVLEEGMVTSDEPGVYIEGAYGIRIENEILCHKDVKNEYGQFMSFETLTVVPIDLDLVDKKYLEQVDVDRLNAYHSMVYEKINPYLNEQERNWLKHYTREI